MSKTKSVNIGIDESDRKEVARHLSHFLADTYSVYLTTQRFHWNVTGPLFQPLHEMLEEHYTDLAEAVDLVAERIRSLGYMAPGSFREFGELANVKQPDGPLSAERMVEWLVDAQETVVRTARGAIPATEKAGDESSLDMLVERMRVHEKRAWMLRAMLEGKTADAESLQAAFAGS